ncbi:transglutaminase family protein [Novosphingobium aquae]|jgi:transglutaminase-like putative cysteine protease|uniref:Transglutaminase family protein n=1 Tax=Novosphingobium aquae TaxID=3133435 RepID=A0ABU8S438_9SPHN
MRLSVRHSTRYTYDEPVAHGLIRLRMRPKPTHGQHVVEWTMNLDGARMETEFDDHHSTHVALVSIVPGVPVLEITCSGIVETADRSGIVGPHIGCMPLWAFARQTTITRPGPQMKAIIAACQPQHDDRLAMLHTLSQTTLAEAVYETGHTSVGTTAEEALSAGRGVCQDHAHIFIGCARALGVPARYVSGYLMMDDRIDQEATHGWAEAHIDGLGWVGFDVSNGISPDARYVRVATGFDYRDAAPVTGLSWGGGKAALAVTLAVEHQAAQQ